MVYENEGLKHRRDWPSKVLHCILCLKVDLVGEIYLEIYLFTIWIYGRVGWVKILTLAQINSMWFQILIIPRLLYFIVHLRANTNHVTYYLCWINADDLVLAQNQVWKVTERQLLYLFLHKYLEHNSLEIVDLLDVSQEKPSTDHHIKTVSGSWSLCTWAL